MFSPLLFYKADMNKKSTLNFLRVLSWALLGLNQRPPDYESGALTS